MRIVIQQKRYPQYTLGTLTVYDYDKYPVEKSVFQCHCLQLPWENNQPNVSCIPDGIYPLVLEWSEKFQMFLWEIYEVPNRSECKIHTANYVKQLNGCIAPGLRVGDINADGLPDMVESKLALQKLHEVLEPREYCTLEIKTL